MKKPHGEACIYDAAIGLFNLLALEKLVKDSAQAGGSFQPGGGSPWRNYIPTN